MCLAIPGQIVQFTDAAKHLATVEVSGVRRQINVDLLRHEALQTGDWVLIHVGFAMSKISQQEAEDQLKLLAMLGEGEQMKAELEGYAFADPPKEESNGKA
jgi:hydrogenase expression/formation protein HypC